ncbi:MAG: flagellar export protein FliJ [Bdellovibrionales bacterium]|nr:flagellar export protein FliJ [Bdellovibrionales bacterium]
MKRFRFRLQKVLDYRATVKREKENELAQKNYELRTAEEILDQIIDEQDSHSLAETTVTSMAELSLTGEYQARLRDALENQRLLILDAASAVEDARNAYIEKAIEKEILEELRSKRHEEFREEERKRERKEIDELVVQRHRLGKPSADN